MGMSTHIIGFAPPDERWEQMKAIFDACENAGIEIPLEVELFFADGRPDPCGVEVAISHSEYYDNNHCREGFEITLADIPSHITHIRFWNSW